MVLLLFAQTLVCSLIANVICELEIRADEVLEIGCAFITHTETEFYVVLWS